MLPFSLDLQVRCRAASLQEVRDQVDTLQHLPTRTFDAVKLATNELVANSIRHSGLGERDFITIRIKALTSRVRIDVLDRGGGFVLPDGEPQGDGRGLAMVQALSALMGISHDGVTHAWAEIELA